MVETDLRRTILKVAGTRPRPRRQAVSQCQAKSEPGKIDRQRFLQTHGLTEEEFRTTELGWSVLDEISERHSGMTHELQTAATYISQRLQSVPGVHSLKVRIKHPEHLIAKIIRKKLEDPDLTFDANSYEERITDLIGIRALHLFKDEWRSIHDFVMRTWERHEDPIAFIRDGDPKELVADLAGAGFNVKQHQFGYRSIHYVIKFRPANRAQLAELQVRTIFEEGWSEIDHRVRYPRRSDDPYLADFLRMFNRLAGSADEMGTFIKRLSVRLREQSEQDRQIEMKEDQLKILASKLTISRGEKEELERQIAEFWKAYRPSECPSIYSGPLSVKIEPSSFLINAGMAAAAAAHVVHSEPQLHITSSSLVLNAGGQQIVSERTCSGSGKRYIADLMNPSYSDLCEDCRRKLGR